ncbi:MAG: DUF1080 domain-containing protein [Planctomycetaceae bacterium]|jgi:HEAT repeat protein|nr:DUF1080 domain-containing protein [Planctomycetaceae bacterium]
MNKIFSCAFLVLFASSIVFAQSGKPSPDETEKNIKILQEIFKDPDKKPSDSQFHTASKTVLNLTQKGTEAAIPELKKLLVHEELNTVVRTALVNIGEAGVVAMRESLVLLEGKNLAGVIESLAYVRDAQSDSQLVKLTQSTDPVVAKSAIIALGKIATRKSVIKLRSILSNPNSKFREEAAAALLYAAEDFTASNNNASALTIFKELYQHKEFLAIWSAAAQSYILLDEERGLQIFGRLLLSKNETEFKTARSVAVKIKSPRAGKLILNSLPRLSDNKKVTLIEILGIRKDQFAVTKLIEFAESDVLVIRLAAIKALGRIGDTRGIGEIFNAIDSKDKAIADAGKASLSMLQGAEFNETMIKNLDSANKLFRLAALKVIAERRIVAATDKVKLLFDDADVDVKVAAYHSFAQMIVAVPADLEFLLNIYQKAISDSVSDVVKEGLREALGTICRKIPARDEGVAVIEKFRDKGDVKNKQFLMDLLFFIGNTKACKAIADFAKSNENDVVDHATMLLGKWSSVDAAPFLIELAENLSAERYRVRTLSGYLRVIRQFGLPLEQKYEMIQKAETVAKRDADKKRVVEIKEKIQSQLRAKPIFDGKTFEGWEGNLGYFRVENGVIIAGTFEKRIPRNEFLCTKKEYGDFTLHLEIKVLGNGANAGVQFRSKRLTEDKNRPNEVSGYQADMTETAKFWGSLYDEARRGKFLAEANFGEVEPLFRPNDWNEVKIVCKENNIKLYLNGKMTVDYTETDNAIPKSGIIGLQIHAGNPSEAWYRNIRIEE